MLAFISCISEADMLFIKHFLTWSSWNDVMKEQADVHEHDRLAYVTQGTRNIMCR